MILFKRKLSTYLPYLIFLIPLVNNPWGIANPSELSKFVFTAFYFSGLLVFVILRIFLHERIVVVYNKAILIFCTLWILSLALSTIFAVAPVESFFGTYERLFGLITYAFYLCIFIFFLSFLNNQAGQNITIWMVAITGGLISLYGIVQYFTLDFTSLFSAGRAFSGRIFSFLSSPNDLGQYLIFTVIASILLAVKTCGEKKSSWLKIIFALLLAVQFAALILSGNRASMLALAVAGCVWLIIRYRLKAVIPLILLAALIFFGAPLIREKIDFRSFNSRIVLWRDTLNLAPQIPFIGTGPESYGQIIQSSLSPEVYNYEKLLSAPEAPHNIILSVWVEQGYLGILLLVIMGVAIIHRITKKYNSLNKDNIFQWALYSVAATAVTMQFSYFSHTSYVFFLVALSIVLIKTISLKKISITFNKSLKAAALLAMPIFVIVIIFGIRLVGSDIIYGNVLEAVISDTDRAVSLYEARADSIPFYGTLYNEPFNLYGTTAIKNQSLTGAMDKFSQRYGWITGWNYEYHIQQGILNYARDNADEAVKEFKIAEIMAPSGFRVYYRWAVAANVADDKTSAVYAIKKGLSLVPAKWRNEIDPQSLTAEEKEQYRIFSLSNPLYFALLDLRKKYEQ